MAFHGSPYSKEIEADKANDSGKIFTIKLQPYPKYYFVNFYSFIHSFFYLDRPVALELEGYIHKLYTQALYYDIPGSAYAHTNKYSN